MIKALILYWFVYLINRLDCRRMPAGLCSSFLIVLKELFVYFEHRVELFVQVLRTYSFNNITLLAISKMTKRKQ